jgi:hypothetical protein
MSYLFIRVLRLFRLAWDVKQPPPGIMPGAASQAEAAVAVLR